jgi:DHA1 family tetracycline resistance protein-like MFS transporter
VSEAPDKLAAPGAPGDSPIPGGPRRATVTFIFVTVVLDVLALGVIIPVHPQLIKQFMGGDTAQASQMVGLFATVWALMQFIFAPIMGALSDRYGRRRVILISNFGLGLDFILMALAPSLWFLFAGTLISGITAASFAAAQAYIADVTPPEKRASTYGMIGAAWGLGFILGPALGGLLGGVDPRLPFWVAAALTLLNACYGLFVLPESLPRTRRAPFSWKRANPIGSLLLLRAHPGLLSLALVVFLYWLAHSVLPNVFVLYADFRYGWKEQRVGLTLALVGICSVIVQALLVRHVVKRFGEARALMAGLTFGALGYAAYGLASTGLWFTLAIPLFAPIGLFSPSVQALMTKRVAPTEQGRLQGAVSSIAGVAGVFGPGLFTQVFAFFVHEDARLRMPGAPFFLAAALSVIALLIAWWTLSRGGHGPRTKPD